MTKNEAMKLAFEALIAAKTNHGVMLMSDPPQEAWKFNQVDLKIFRAEEALHQALEQPEQEPVGWYDSISGEIDFTFYKPLRKPSSPSAKWIPVYTAPHKREWVGLTDEEIINHFQTDVDTGSLLSFADGARYAEAKLKEKNCD